MTILHVHIQRIREGKHKGDLDFWMDAFKANIHAESLPLVYERLAQRAKEGDGVLRTTVQEGLGLAPFYDTAELLKDALDVWQ